MSYRLRSNRHQPLRALRFFLVALAACASSLHTNDGPGIGASTGGVLGGIMDTHTGSTTATGVPHRIQQDSPSAPPLRAQTSPLVRRRTPIERDRCSVSSSSEGRVSDARHEYLDDQTTEFRDTDGSRWRVRIEQGGGEAAAEYGDPPVAVLIFRSLADDRARELAIRGEVGRWKLSSYSDANLRALLSQAQAHASIEGSE